MSAKLVAARFERRAQLAEIINFTVEDNTDITGFVEDRLVSAGKIDNAETAHAKGNRRSDEDAVFVRTAMPYRIGHPASNRFASFRLFNSDSAAYSAHSPLL
jgi:hypothetical protein